MMILQIENENEKYLNFISLTALLMLDLSISQKFRSNSTRAWYQRLCEHSKGSDYDSLVVRCLLDVCFQCNKQLFPIMTHQALADENDWTDENGYVDENILLILSSISSLLSLV